MSVIIRLQNLPWCANAANIRSFFQGLSIPEGGVHIVGGTRGDAFIAFSTDEDARQAMLLDGGDLKETQIKLMLSSRTEMLRVIEQARQQALKIQDMQGLMSFPPVPQQPPAVAAIGLGDQNKEVAGGVVPKEEDKNRDGVRQDRSSSRERDRKSRDDSSDRGRDRKGGRDRDRRRRDRSRSRERYRSRRSRSYERRRPDKDRYGRDRERDNRDKDQDKRGNTESSQPPQKTSTTLPTHTKPSPAPDQVIDSPPKPQIPDPPTIPQMLLQFQQNGKDLPGMPQPPEQMSMPNFGFPPVYIPTNIQPHIQNPQQGWMGGMPMRPMMNPGTMGMPPPRGPMMGDIHMQNFRLNYPTPGMGFQPNMFQQPGMPTWRMPQPMVAQGPEVNAPHLQQHELCVEVRGLPLVSSYVDIKKLFDDCPIPKSGIKFINDTHGNRTGIAYVKFATHEDAQTALKQNGQKVRHNVVEVLELRHDIYESAIDNFKPEKPKMEKTCKGEWANGRDGRTQRSLDGVSNGVVIRGASNCSDRDIHDFFSEVGIAPIDINFKDFSGGSCGEIHCVFENEEEICKAVSKNKSYIGRAVVSVERTGKGQSGWISGGGGGRRGERGPRVSRFEPRDEAAVEEPSFPEGLNCGELTPPMRDPRRAPLLQDPPVEQAKSFQNDRQFNDRGANSRFPMDGPPMMNGPPPDRPPRVRPPNLAEDRPNDFPFPMTDRFNSNNRWSGDGPPSGQWSDRGGDHRDMRNRMNYNDRRDNHSEQPMDRRRMGRNEFSPNQDRPRGPSGKGPMDQKPHRPGSPYIDNNTVDNFGQRGCVVALENVNFRADIDTILQFFSGFSVDSDSVIRRFDEHGRPTGDARVCFRNRQEAARAVDLLNRKPMLGRSVSMYVL